MILNRIVSASLSPNVERGDIFVALRMLLSPTRWLIGPSRLATEKWLGKYLGNSNVLSFNSGRSALFILLRAFGIGSGDEVVVQAFTCVAVPNSVIWTGAKPVYADIDDTLNIDPVSLASKITPKTRAIIVQHTLGIPADMDGIMAIARKNKLLVFEDCAHSLATSYKGQKVGTFGDGAIFSFGRDKVLSSVFGGMAVVSKEHPDAVKRFKELHGNLPYPTGFWIMRQIFHPLAFALILPWYRLGPGKIFLWILQKIKFLGLPVYPEEKHGHRPAVFPRKYPNAMATLLLSQIKKFDTYTKRRAETVVLYEAKLKGAKGITLLSSRPGASYLRYPILVEKPAQTFLRARRHGLLLGNWYQNVIDPKGVSFAAVFYKRKSCPVAEEVSSRIINLPTLIRKKDAIRVIHELTS